MPRFLLVKGVEGRLLLDPRTIGMHRHFIGHERKVVGIVDHPVYQGMKVEDVKHVFKDGEERVPEPFADNYFRTAILNGCIEYVATLELDKDDDDAKEISRTREVDLVRATAIHRAQRAHDAKAAADAEEAGKALHEQALADAEAAGDAHADKLESAAQAQADARAKAATDAATSPKS